MRKLGSGWVCEDCKSYGKEGETTPHSPGCPSKEVPFGPPKDAGVDAGFRVVGDHRAVGAGGGDEPEMRRGLEMTPLVVPVEGAPGLYKAGPMTRAEVEEDDRIVREAELSPAEMAEIGGERLEERVEPQLPTDLELEKPAATPEELRALAGLPVAEEERCGVPGPDSLMCRLKPGHEGGLHAAKGRTWTDDWLEAAGGKTAQGIREAVGEGALEDRLVAAIERGVVALEGIRGSIEHYVQETLHRTR